MAINALHASLSRVFCGAMSCPKQPSRLPKRPQRRSKISQRAKHGVERYVGDVC